MPRKAYLPAFGVLLMLLTFWISPLRGSIPREASIKNAANESARDFIESRRSLNSVYDPQVEHGAAGSGSGESAVGGPAGREERERPSQYLELGINNNGGRAWGVYVPDRSGSYGGAQGVGGIEAFVDETGGSVTGQVNNSFGDTVGFMWWYNGQVGVLQSSGYGLTLGGYGPQPGTGLYSSINGYPMPEWRGRYPDTTGPVYSGARYYEARSGRFLSPDPLGHGASLSLYDYANGDPVNGLDPDGRFGKQVWNSTLGEPHVQGALMMGQGALEATAAGGLLATPEPTMLTKVGGGLLLLHASDVASAGWNQMWTGQPTQTFTSQGVSGGLQYAGVPAPYANMAGGLTDPTIGIASGRITMSMPEIPTTTINYVNVERSASQNLVLGPAAAENGMAELAQFRQELGPIPGGGTADGGTLARLDMGGAGPIYGVSAHGTEISLNVNAISATHAEADAFQQAANAGLSGGNATLYVDRELCGACGMNGGVKSMASQLGIKQLTIVTPKGVVVMTIP